MPPPPGSLKEIDISLEYLEAPKSDKYRNINADGKREKIKTFCGTFLA